MIVSVQRGGPGRAGRTAVRDVVVDVDGRPTANTPTLLARIAQLQPGSTAKVTVLRDGQAGSARRDRRPAAEGERGLS